MTKTFRFLTGGFHLLPLLLQLIQNILKILVTLTHQVIGFLQDLLRKAQFSGNGKGIGLARNADQQLIGGPQGFHIEFAGSVDNTLGPHGIKLQFRIVGCCHHTAAHLPAEFNDSHCQRSTLGRIRSCTKLIEQYQGPVVTLSYHIHDGSHMAGEGGKALGNGLLVTDIRKNGIKGGQLTAIPCRYMKATFRHQRQKTDGF